MNSQQYIYRVIWSAEDNEYIGLCDEFPSLSWLDATPSEALSGIVNIVADVVKDLINSNEKIPTSLYN